MTITVPSIPITGVQESLIRDNVANPDANLGARALEQLVAPYRSATLSRAQAAYRAAYAADPADKTLPNMLNDEAVIAWYLGTEGYQDATAREAVQVAARAENEIQSLTAERQRHINRLTGASDELKETIQATIDSLSAQIVALQQ